MGVQKFPSNAHRDAEESRPEVSKVIEGGATRKKKPFLQRLRASLFADSAGSVGGYILREVVVPAMKQTLLDALSNGGERLLYGDGARSAPRHGYGRMRYSDAYRPERRDISRRARNHHTFDELVFDTRSDAELILSKMQDLLESYNFVTVADFYDLAGVSDTSYMDGKWGWSNLSRARVVRDRGGYILDLPPTEES